MKVVIADDEYLARMNLKCVLAEEDPTMTIAGEAKNGEELIRLVEEHQPDAVFVDIRMPNLDGLSAVRKGKEISPFSEWVVISGFSEFDYAHEALRLGVSNYLLKPVNPDEIHACLKNLRQKKSETITALNRDFENLATSALHGSLSSRECAVNPFFHRWRFMGYVLYSDSRLNDNKMSELHGAFVSDLHGITRNLLERDNRIAVTTLSDRIIAVIWARHLSNSDAVNPGNGAFERLLTERTRHYAANELAVTLYRTDTWTDFETMLKDFSLLKELGPLRAVLPPGRCWRRKDLSESTGKEGEWLRIALRLERICGYYRAGDYLNYSKESALLGQDLKVSEQPGLGDRMSCIRDYLRRSIGFVSANTEPGEWIKQLERHGEANLHAYPEEKDKDVVQVVVDYVMQHYMRDIGIGQIAEEVGVTPNYLSALFHKKCGMTFIQFLTKTRMIKAKQLLLSEPKMQVQKIALAVGYYSTRHFTKKFTEYYQCYPSDMRAAGMIPDPSNTV